MKISLQKAKKKFYPNTSFPMVIVEAVANAIDAQATRIEIAITRNENTPLSLEVKDNGVGLTAERYNRFSELLDTEDEKHKGIGRLAYLSYFDTIDFESYFRHENRILKRNFTFTHDFDETDREKIEQVEDLETGTNIIFTNFNNTQIGKTAFLESDYYREKLESHFFYAFINSPNMILRSNHKNINLYFVMLITEYKKEMAIYLLRWFLTTVLTLAINKSKYVYLAAIHFILYLSQNF